MQPIDVGFYSLFPPIIAIALALITKEVISSLMLGILSGGLIYAVFSGGGLVAMSSIAFEIMAKTVGTMDKFYIILFLALLGSLVCVVTKAGGSYAYGKWATQKIKSKRAAELATSLLGVLIFIDDYFNCLTVGAGMRPVTDRFNISREKLAWIIDSTAAPICIIAPVSSWAVAVGGYLGEGGFTTFVQSIPYNFYALLTIVFVFFMCFSNRDFGPMRQAEADAHKSADQQQRIPSPDSALEAVSTARLDGTAEGDPLPAKIETIVAERDELEDAAKAAVEEFKGMTISDKGRVFDLIVPIIVLIVFSILGMLYAGGFFQGVDFSTAVGENPVFGLCIGVCVALVVSAGMFLPRKLMTLSGYMEGISEGVRSMVGAIMILVLAWSLGGTCRYLLGTGEFVSGFLNSIGVGLELLPAVIFLVAAFIGFAMGTSWGTIALILPIVIGVFPVEGPLFLVAVGATLGGAVYGDHVSPISDTTILSSAGAQCNHLRHVATQLPYASVVAVICFAGYVVAGFTGNPWISLAGGAVVMVLAVLVLNRSKYGAAK